MVGGQVLRLRLDAGLTQQELADRAGISVRALQDLERGRVARPRARSVDGLLTALGLTPEQRQSVLAGLVPGSVRGTPDPGPERFGMTSSVATPPAVTGLRVRLLGPLQVSDGGEPLEVGPPRVRSLFALLALHPGETVSRDEIVDVLWAGEPPRTCGNLVQGYVSRLRSALARPSVGNPGRGEQSARVELSRHGYRLDLDPQALDLVGFRQDQATARQARDQGRPEDALRAWASALDRWTGPVLADLESALREHPTAVRVSWERTTVVLAHADLCLEQGVPHQAVPELQRVTADEPLHEDLHARLVLALAAAGDRAAALGVYRDVRRRLADELGVDPGPALRDAHRQVLEPGATAPGPVGSAPVARGGAVLPAGPVQAGAVPAGAALPAGPGELVPRQLPAEVADFVGRADELSEVVGLLSGAGSEQRAPAVVLVSGTAGVGKTAFAVKAAHRVRERFPDGQLHLNLRGYDPGDRLEAAEALTQLLTALGIPSTRLPSSVPERSAMLRSVLSGRRVLLLLDNVADEEQVRPLLPGTATCAVIVTSRSTLPGLVARDGAQRRTLALLPTPDAVSLVRRLTWRRDDDAVLARLVASCAGLPLALRVAAEYVAADPGAPLEDLVDALADERRRLDVLDTIDDPYCQVRAVLSWSYRRLLPDVARTFRLLGHLPGGTIDDAGAAALCDREPDLVREHLAQLRAAHLLEWGAVPGALAMHDLLRDYAAELAAEQDGEVEIRAAQGRYLDHYVATMEAVVRALVPTQSPRFGSTLPERGVPVDLVDTGPAREWLDRHERTVDVVLGLAATHGWPELALKLVVLIERPIRVTLLNGVNHTAHEQAVAAARALGRPGPLAVALVGLSTPVALAGDYPRTIEILLEARTLAQEAGDLRAEAAALNSLGWSLYRTGRAEEAHRTLTQGLEACVRSGDVDGQVYATTVLGNVEAVMGRHVRALQMHRQALRLAIGAGNRYGEAQCLNNLASVELDLGRLSSAARTLRRGLEVARSLNYRECEAILLANLASVGSRQDRPDEAVDLAEQGLAIARRMGFISVEAAVSAELGGILRRAGRLVEAETILREAIDRCELAGEQSALDLARQELALLNQELTGSR